jgi:hypothetical protein
MLLALAVLRRSAAVVAVSGGLGGARGGVGATRLGGCGVTCGSFSFSCWFSAGCGVVARFLCAGDSSRE